MGGTGQDDRGLKELILFLIRWLYVINFTTKEGEK